MRLTAVTILYEEIRLIVCLFAIRDIDGWFILEKGLPIDVNNRVTYNVKYSSKIWQKFFRRFSRHPHRTETGNTGCIIRFGVAFDPLPYRSVDTFAVRTKSEDFWKNVEVKSESWGALADLDPNVTSHHLSGNGVIVVVRGSFQIEVALLISYR